MRIVAGIVVALGLVPTSALAADVLVVSNQYAQDVANDFAVNTSHTYTAWDADVTPTVADLQAYDVVLLFEDGVFPNAVNVGNVVAEFYEGGGNLVTATFYLQDRSDAGFGGSWGALEAIDVFNGAPGGCEYGPDDLDPNSIVDHPITAGLQSLHSDNYRGGAGAMPDTTVLAAWTGANNLGGVDPLVGIREDGDHCFVGITIAPHHPIFGGFSGDFHLLFDNALTWAAACGVPVEPVCGNGIPEQGEACDDGNDDDSDACLSGCIAATCGDGVVHVGVEECDDGDLVDDDACSNACTMNVPGTGSDTTGSDAGSDSETTGGETGIDTGSAETAPGDTTGATSPGETGAGDSAGDEGAETTSATTVGGDGTGGLDPTLGGVNDLPGTGCGCTADPRRGHLMALLLALAMIRRRRAGRHPTMQRRALPCARR